MEKSLSIQTKVLITLLLLFLAMVISSTVHTFFSERQLVHDVVLNKAHDTAYAYFDGVNTMMLTGTTAQRETLREKLMANPDVMEVRMLRAESVNKTFGKGLDSEQPVDDLDRRALGGEEVLLESELQGDRVITLVQPVLASKDYRGTNCLNCHVVPENTVLGAVRVTYSLASLDQRIANNLINSGLLNAVLFGLGIGAVVWLLHRIVFTRLARMQNTMQKIEKESDLRERMQVQQMDEIGRVGSALNSMLGRFSDGLLHVADTTRKLTGATERLASVADQTSSGVVEQRNQTDSMATAINELEATAQEVRRSAASTADASHSADAAAREGTELTAKAIAGIQQLVAELQRAEEVIGRLDERSRNVGSVLDVIKGIAEQTNLLALNAAIEAARAGEKGRGFAVVADEVRTLANRSHESTQEIESIIEQLQQEASEAVTAMGSARTSAEKRSEQLSSAAESLAQIAAQVADINALNTQMARAADEQSTVTEDVNRNVMAITQIADRTAQEAGETAQVSDELVHLTQKLDQMLGNYRL
jgi:methyl-accepting chemotaxis protein